MLSDNTILSFTICNEGEKMVLSKPNLLTLTTMIYKD